jgi:hypothetical protein
MAFWQMGIDLFFRPTPGGFRQVVYPVGKHIAFDKLD